MKTSNRGIELIKRFEGLRLKAYICSGGVDTIGYGTTILPNGIKVPKSSTCTKEQAEMFLKNDLEKFEAGVRKLVTVPIKQNQFDALVCFSYNVGLGALAKSTLLKKININPNSEEIESEFMKWSFAKHIQLEGLRLRRKAESELYEKIN
jgi:lysozyme